MPSQDATVESLEKQVRTLTDTVKRLESEFRRYIDSPYLDRDLDNQSKDILSQTVSDKILDIVWNEYYHYHTFFEAVGAAGNYGWVLSSSGTSSVDQSGLFLETGAVSGNQSYIYKDPEYQNILTFDLESRFRTAFYVDSNNTSSTVTASNIYAFIGGGDGYSSGNLAVSTSYYGFALEGSTLYGVTSNGTTGTKSVALTDIKYGHLYLLEARYYPGTKAEFYVSDGTPFPNVPQLSERPKFRCSISTTLPTGDGTLARFQVVTNEAVKKNLGIGFYEYIQRKVRL